LAGNARERTLAVGSAEARIFARGGNAIDTGITATFVEGVVNPHLHIIDGEAPMLIYSANAAWRISINHPHGSLPGVLRI
jgi:gamma-glutamyltranspeptidase